jgi:tetratricopeptide (TPR) repeat protein
MMKRTLTVATASLLLVAGCAAVKQYSNHSGSNPYEKPLFYTRFMNPSGNALDAAIMRDVNGLRANPRDAALHNELGQYLAQRGFPKDAEREFERAVDADRKFWPAWYNLGLTRAARGEYVGARVAFGQTLRYRSGHSEALFQQGLLEEEKGHNSDAVELYAKAFSINHRLLDVRTNPRILDSKLVHLALMRAYPNEHVREALIYQSTPPSWNQQPVAGTLPAPPPAQVPDKLMAPTTSGPVVPTTTNPQP